MIPATLLKQKKLAPDSLAMISLISGSHRERASGVCAMELVAWMAGEPHSDHPDCTCPVLGAFIRSWNDDLPGADRDRLLKPILPQLIGTRATKEVELQRAILCGDWVIRVNTPAWLDLAGLKTEAAALRALPEIRTRKDALAARPALKAAGE